MKKTLIVCALCIFSTSALFAQGVGVGIKGGLNFVSLDGADASSRSGIHFGAYAKIMATDNFGVQGEILYSVQGADTNFQNVKQTIDANYVNIPILLKFSPVPILNFHAGPQFGLLLSADQDGNDIKDDLKNSDLSVAVGAGLDLPMGLNLTLRYVKGLSDVEDVAGIDLGKNNLFQVSVGFELIGLGK